MASFYLSPIDAPEVIYELHATTSIQVGFSSSVTNYPIETGSSVSDNIVMNPETVSFSGFLTDVSQTAGFSPITFITNLIKDNDKGSPKKLKEYIEDLRLLQFEKIVFKVFFSGDSDTFAGEIDFAILTQFDLSKDPSLGTSWGVTVTLQQVRFAQQAQLVAVPAEAFALLNAKNAKAQGNGGGLTEPQSCTTVDGLNRQALLNAGKVVKTGAIGTLDCLPTPSGA